VTSANPSSYFRFDWLRGLDLNQRPLGYEPASDHHPLRTGVTVRREITGMRSPACPLFALLRAASGHILGTAGLEDPILVPVRDERREITPRANRRALPLHASVLSARSEVENGAQHTHRAGAGSSVDTACCAYAPRS